MNLKLLTQYLFQYHRLPLPGFGSVSLVKQSAILNMIDKRIQPVTYTLEFDTASGTSDHLTAWVSVQKNITISEARQVLERFAEGIRNLLDKDGEMHWGTLGVLKKNEGGSIQFSETTIRPLGYETLNAEKIIKGNAGHDVLVGDRIYKGDSLKKMLEDKKEVISAGTLRPYFILLIVMTVLICIIALVNPGFIIKHQLQFKSRAATPPETYQILGK